MLRWIFFFTFFILVLIGSFGWFIYNHRVEFASNALTQIFEVPVKISDIKFQKTGLLIKDFDIHNPKNCSRTLAFTTKKVEVQMNWFEIVKGILGIASDEILIDQITV